MHSKFNSRTSAFLESHITHEWNHYEKFHLNQYLVVYLLLEIAGSFYINPFMTEADII